jgi:hypothetical protein
MFRRMKSLTFSVGRSAVYASKDDGQDGADGLDIGDRDISLTRIGLFAEGRRGGW